MLSEFVLSKLKVRSSRFISVLSVCAIAAVLFATLGATAPASAPKKEWPRSVKKAFKTIGTKECFEHVSILAADRFEGRAAGEDGGRLASEYIAQQFILNDVAPGGPGGSYFQRFPLLLAKARQGELAQSNYLHLLKAGGKGEAFDLVDDLLPAEISAEIATGGSIEYLNGEDAAGELPVRLDGAVVVVSEETLAAEIARESASDGPRKVLRVETATGEGRVVSRDEDDDKTAPDTPPAPEPPRPLARFADAGVRALLVTTSDKKRAFAEDAWPTGEAGLAAMIPVLLLTQKASDKLLRRGGTKVAKAEKAAKVNFKEWKVFLSVSRLGHPYGLGRNVVGMLPGTDPELKEEMVVIGAHFDHVGYARNPRLTNGKSGEIHNGADDNASGISGLMELSQAFSTQPKVERARTLIFIAFDAEELGLVGSNYYVAQCPHDIDKTVAMLNMDMISRNGAQEMYYGKDGRFGGLNAIVEGVGDYFSIHLDRTGMDKYMDRSDQAAFIARGIPAVFLYGGDHPQYHTELDDLERINPIKIQNIARFMFLCAYECANHRGGFKE